MRWPLDPPPCRCEASVSLLVTTKDGFKSMVGRAKIDPHGVVILTAIDKESTAVRGVMTDVRSEQVRGTRFWTGNFDTWNIALAEIGPGNNTAAAIAERALAHFKPKYAAFVGVAGGLKDVQLGDVVVATKVYGYESGKAVPGAFRPRPDVRTSDHVLEHLARAARSEPPWAGGKPRIFVGPIAAGEKVVADNAGHVAELIASTYGDALAVEMEGRGFLEAVHIHAGCHAVVVRGISDLLIGKADADALDWQSKAAENAVRFFCSMLSLDARPQESPGTSRGRTAPVRRAAVKSPADGPIFVSAVSSEFEVARNEIRDDLLRRDREVRTQKDFDLHEGTLLEKLDAYIRDCAVVICLIGRRSGAFPQPDEAKPFSASLPDGMTCASYTQWEFLLAKRHRKPVLLFVASDDYLRDRKNDLPDDNLAAQAAFYESQIKSKGLDKKPFINTHELVRAVTNQKMFITPTAPKAQPEPKIKPASRPSPAMVANGPNKLPAGGERRQQTKEERLLRLTGRLEKVLTEAPEATAALWATKPSGDRRRAKSEPAGLPFGGPKVIVADLLGQRDFRMGIGWLNNAYDKLRTNGNSIGREAVHNLSRHLLPYLYISTDPSLKEIADTMELINVPGVLSLPIGLGSWADIVMAGFDIGAVRYVPPAERRGYPAPELAASVQPESGKVDATERNLRLDLLTKLGAPPGWENDPDGAVNYFLSKYFKEESRRPYWLVKIPDNEPERSSVSAMADRVSSRYPLLAVIPLDAGLYLTQVELFDSIRDILGYGTDGES